VNVSFNGTAVELFALTGPDWGKASVTLDGVLQPGYVDFYTPGYIYQKSVYLKTALTPGDHTLNIKCLGTGLVNLDAVKVTGTPGTLNQATAPAAPPMPPAPTLFQQTDPKIAFAEGVWVRNVTSPACGGCFHYTGIPEAAVNVSFTGTSVELLALTGPDWGRASVTLDGVLQPGYVEFYSPTYIFQKSVYLKTGLTNGPHTLTLECTGEKNPAASGIKIDLDAVIVTGTPGTLTQATAPPAPPTPPTPTLYEQNDPKIAYAPDWIYHVTSPASGGSFNYTGVAGASVNVSFTGTSVELLALTGPDWGKALITLDGVSQEVDLYSSTYIFQRSVYLKAGLADSTHTLTIECTGEKNPAATGTKVDLDALRILGILN
jgi:hypothetical protein